MSFELFNRPELRRKIIVPATAAHRSLCSAGPWPWPHSLPSLLWDGSREAPPPAPASAPLPGRIPGHAPCLGGGGRHRPWPAMCPPCARPVPAVLRRKPQLPHPHPAGGASEPPHALFPLQRMSFLPLHVAFSLLPLKPWVRLSALPVGPVGY